MRAGRQRRRKSLYRGGAFGIFSTKSRAAGAMSGRLKASNFFRPLPPDVTRGRPRSRRSEEHTSELQSLMRISYAVFCLKKKKNKHIQYTVTLAKPYNNT